MSERPGSIVRDRAADDRRPLDRALADEALTTFVGQHYDRLLGLARLVCRDAVDASDAVQVGLEHAWRRRADLRDPERLRSWLDRIVVREASRIARRRRSWLGRLALGSPSVQWTEVADERDRLPEALLMLRDAFTRLHPDQRAALALHVHLGYSVAETAELLGAPEETVRTRIRRAKDRLRADLGEVHR